MLQTLRSTLRRRVVLVAAGTAVAVAAGGGATAAFASTGASTPAPTASHCTVRLGAVLHGGTKGALRAELKKLRAEPKADRAAERKVIREHALQGEYGQRVERLAHLFGTGAGGHSAFLKTLPAALQTDLKALRKLPKGDSRKAAAQQIVQKALGGDYGTALQTRATQVQERVQARCAAKQG